MHTSTVTVAILEPLAQAAPAFQNSEVRMRFTKDRGPGGQHRNKTQSCVVLTHVPTGTTVKVDGRNQHLNRRQAYRVLEERLQASISKVHEAERSRNRREQVGSGERGDKIRTYRVQDGQVIDHRTNAKTSLREVLSGNLELLHKHHQGKLPERLKGTAC